MMLPGCKCVNCWLEQPPSQNQAPRNRHSLVWSLLQLPKVPCIDYGLLHMNVQQIITIDFLVSPSAFDISFRSKLLAFMLNVHIKANEECQLFRFWHRHPQHQHLKIMKLDILCWMVAIGNTADCNDCQWSKQESMCEGYQISNPQMAALESPVKDSSTILFLFCNWKYGSQASWHGRRNAAFKSVLLWVTIKVVML